MNELPCSLPNEACVLISFGDVESLSLVPNCFDQDMGNPIVWQVCSFVLP